MTFDHLPNEQANDLPIDRLADRVLQGLDIQEDDGLEFDLEAQSLEFAAAAAVLASLDLDRLPQLPEALALKIAENARGTVVPVEPLTSLRMTRRRRFLEPLGWWVAAAAIAFALLSLPRTSRLEKISNSSIEAVLNGSPSSAFANTGHPLGKGAAGKVVWNEASRQGYLAIEGLPPIDPRKGIYQLWIFDADRDARYPVDGGMFSVDKASKTSIIPIHAAVEVRKPTLFAVTLEPPGGVVVSDRQRLLLTAPWSEPAPKNGQAR